MIWWILSGLLLFLVTYVTYVLFLSKDPETKTSLNDFIKPEVETGLVVQRDDGLSKYYTSYDQPGRQVLLLYGTEYGFSEEVARKLFDRMMETESLQSLAIQPRVLNCKYFERLDFTKENVVLCVFSTTGDGVPPTDSRPFFDHLDTLQSSSLTLSHLRYSVLALGDYNYPHFCRTGRGLDARLSELGASCLYSRVDVDMEDWGAIERWMGGALEKVGSLDIPLLTDYLDLSRDEEEMGVSRTRPFMAHMTVRYNLTASDAPADKETFHAEFDLTDSEITYTAGDALGIYPRNNPPEVLAVLNALRAGKETQVPVPQQCYFPRPEGEFMDLEQVLLYYYDLKTVKPDLIKYLTNQTVDSQQKEKGEHILEGGVRENISD